MRRGVENRNRLLRLITPCLALALVVGAGLALSSGYGRAQTARPRLQAEANFKETSLDSTVANYQAHSELVLIPVRVEDSRHGCVGGLQKEQFKVYDDKVEQVITHFNSEDAPVSVGIVFDASGSMDDKVGASRDAVMRVLDTAGPGDEFFLTQFNNHVELVAGLTEQTEDIRRRLLWIQPRGGTALLDAIYFSIHQLANAHNSRKALIIISDGGDNSSRYSLTEVRNAVREADVQIYAVGILEQFAYRSRSMEEVTGPALLHELSEQSGGRMFEVTDSNQLAKVSAKIGEALRNQYMLGYVPANPTHDGKYHKVQVKLVPPKGAPKWQAAWRRGYYAPRAKD